MQTQMNRYRYQIEFGGRKILNQRLEVVEGMHLLFWLRNLKKTNSSIPEIPFSSMMNKIRAKYKTT
jgi:hypothetical protein